MPSPGATREAAGDRPNVVLLTAHDMGRYLGCYGRGAQTPNLDSLADDGALFSEFFCPAPSCAPSRACTQTGLLTHNNGMFGHPQNMGEARASSHWKGWNIHDGIRTLPMYLNERGYDTHLAYYQHASRPPERVGYGTIHDHPDPDGQTGGARNIADITERVLREEVDDETPFYLQAATANAHGAWSNRPGGFKDRPIEGYEGPDPDEVELPERYAAIADGWDDIEGHDEATVRQNFADFYEDLYELDVAVGRVIETLEETGHREDTVFVFTSDHGIAHGPKSKFTPYDPGMEASLLINYPGRVDGGATYDALSSSVDILPTILDLVDGQPPVEIDGQSLRPLIDTVDDRSYEAREQVYIEQTWHGSYDPVRGIRTEDSKLIRNFWPGSYENAPRDSVTEVELYDLNEDPYETENVATDPEYADVREELYQRLRSKLQRDNAPILDGPIPPVPGVFDIEI